MPSYSQIYEETGLAANVTAQLPGSTGGASLGLLVAVGILDYLRACSKDVDVEYVRLFRGRPRS